MKRKQDKISNPRERTVNLIACRIKIKYHASHRQEPLSETLSDTVAVPQTLIPKDQPMRHFHLIILILFLPATVLLTGCAGDHAIVPMTFKGKVLNPDGTPADQCLVVVSSIAVSTTLSPAAEASCCPPTSSCCIPTPSTPPTDRLTINTDAKGNFEFSRVVSSRVVSAGTKVMICAHSLSPSGGIVSEPVIFFAEKDRNDITIQLQEGIRVVGTAMLDDGTPVAADTMRAFRLVTPEAVPGSEQMEDQELQAIINAMNNPPMAFQTLVQEDGTFEFYLPPGDFLMVGAGGLIIGPDRTLNVISISRNGEKEYHVDLTYSSDPYGEFIKEDGLFGIIHPISDDELDKFHTAVLKLKPTAAIRVQLHDSSDQPLVGRQTLIIAGIGTKDDRIAWSCGVLQWDSTPDD